MLEEMKVVKPAEMPQEKQESHLEVKRMVVHHLIKNDGEDVATLEESAACIPLEERALKLAADLNASFLRSGIEYAEFAAEKEKIFPQKILGYVKKSGDDAFVIFSREVSEKLKDDIQKIKRAKGGYLIFIEYRYYLVNYITVFMIRDTTGLLFKRDAVTENFEINAIEHLDLDKLAMACRFNPGKYELINKLYLSFIKRRMADISAYFITWVSAQNIVNNKVYTEDLNRLLNMVDCPKDENGQEIDRFTFKENIYDLVKSGPDNVVDLKEISAKYYPEAVYGENYLVDFAEKNGLDINTEFQAENTVLKHLICIDLHADGIQLRFKRSDYPARIHFDKVNPAVIIIESQALADVLKQEVNLWKPAKP